MGVLKQVRPPGLMDIVAILRLGAMVNQVDMEHQLDIKRLSILCCVAMGALKKQCIYFSIHVPVSNNVC